MVFYGTGQYALYGSLAYVEINGARTYDSDDLDGHDIRQW
jgi:hypothetical protein